jgi:hypothetical protein
MKINKQQVLRALRFARITDEQDNLSLTNIAMIVTLVVVLQRPELSLTDIGTFIAAIVGYQVKRFAATGEVTNDSEELKKAIEQLQGKVTALQLGAQIKR